jgi:hypothetical protein
MTESAKRKLKAAEKKARNASPKKKSLLAKGRKRTTAKPL